MTKGKDLRVADGVSVGQVGDNKTVADAPQNEVQQAHTQMPYSPYGGKNTSATPYANQPVSYTVPLKKKWEFTSLQKGFTFVALILGYLFNRLIFSGHAPGLGAMIFFEIILAVFCAYILKEGAKLSVVHYMWLGLLMTFPVSFILTDNPVLKGFGAIFMIVATTYWLNISAKGIAMFRHTFPTDSAQAVFVAPFENLTALPVALFKPAKDSENKTLRNILLGLLVTIPFTAVICALLLSSDETFRNLMRFNSISDNIGEFIVRLIFSVPVAMIIFSSIVSATDKKKQIIEKTRKQGNVNQVVFITAYIPVLLVYVAFFVSQFAYFTGAFSSILPENLTYAEYARQGFFELCAVVAINLAIVLLTEIFCQKNAQGSFGFGVKAVATILSLFSFALVAIFTAKMIMYTKVYGLTHKRIFTLWFTLVLLFVVAMTLVKVFVPKFRFYSVVITGCVLLFALISFANVDSIIAKYNVQWYQQGKISWMGEEALYELDHSAVKYLDALVLDNTEVPNIIEEGYQYYYYSYEENSETVGEQIKGFYQYLSSFDNGIIGYNIPVAEAREIFEQRDIKPVRE